MPMTRWPRPSGAWPRYFTFYNQGRPHAALDGQTPDMVYFGVPPQREAA